MRTQRGWVDLAGAVVLALAAACSDGAGKAPRAGPDLLDAPAAEAGDAPPGAPAIPAAAPTVVFLADSIGAGLHLAEDQAFPAVLQRRLAAEGLPFKLVNASQSGRTSAGGVTALAWTLRSEPDLLVIGLGGNDGLRGTPLEEIERNLRRMLADARDAGVRVLLLGVRLPANYGDYGERFDALYPALAAEFGVDLVPFYMDGVGGVPELNLEDGLHPSPAGHERLADNIAPALRKALEELQGAPAR
jgi:acyl-CoA thioesterase-1